MTSAADTGRPAPAPPPQADESASPLHSGSPRASASWLVRAVLAACVIFYLVNNGLWLLADRSSPSYDKAAHAGFALDYLRLFEAPTRLSFRQLLTVTEYWPPLFHVASVPFTMALGFSVSAVAATNFLFLVVLVWSLVEIGRRLFDTGTGAGAVVLVLLYPMVYAMAREVMVDFALAAMVALALLAVLATDAGLDRRRGWWLGVALGWAMLAKWTAVAFVAGPLVFWLIACLRRHRPSIRSAATALGRVAAAFAVVALPWYISAFEPFLEMATPVALGSEPVREGDPVRFADSVLWYWAATRDVLIGDWLLVPTVAGFCLFAVRFRSHAGAMFLLASTVPALLVFLLLPNKDARFLLPLLPPVALMAAAGLRAVPWATVRALVWAFIVVAGVSQFYAISFGWPARLAHAYTAPPQTGDWKVREILEAVATIDVEPPIWIGLLPNEPDFEPNLFQLTARVERLPVRIDGLGHAREPVEAWRRYRAIVTKSGSIAPEYAADFRPELHADLHDWMRAGRTNPRIQLWRTWPLPDGSRAELFLVQSDP